MGMDGDTEADHAWSSSSSSPPEAHLDLLRPLFAHKEGLVSSLYMYAQTTNCDAVIHVRKSTRSVHVHVAVSLCYLECILLNQVCSDGGAVRTELMDDFCEALTRTRASLAWALSRPPRLLVLISTTTSFELSTQTKGPLFDCLQGSSSFLRWVRV